MNPMQSTLFAEDSLDHANLLVWPGSSEAKRMTVTSGRKCAELLLKHNHVTSWVKMLLESSTWHSTLCYLTWKDSATPQGRLLFRLVPKMADIEEIEYSFWATPNTMDMLPQRSDEALERQATTTRKGRTKPANLREQVNERTVGMWPTPTARDCRPGDATNRQGGSSLSTVAKLWPTPTVNGDYNRKGLSVNSGDGLSTAVKMWGTPAAVSYKGASQYGSPAWERDMERDNLKAQVMEPANTGQLNPDWEETLMNFPVGWTDVDADNHDLYMLPNPAPYGMPQFDFEPPRVTKVKKNRAARVKAVGNAVSPMQVREIFKAIAEIEMAQTREA